MRMFRAGDDGEIMIGEKIRALRQQRGMTISELAEAVGLSPSAVSQIERGTIDPSLRTLRSVADELHSPVFSFFLESPSQGLVVRKNERRSFSLPDRDAEYELLTPDLNRRLEMIFMYLEPGMSTPHQPLPHAGDECLVVLEGKTRVEAGGQQYLLEEGDGIYLDEGVPHKVTNVGEGRVVCVAGITPASF
jgi:transcriptional regulator with XRE-family HTH domain